MIDWDKRFREAHQTSGPNAVSLCIQNTNPKPSAGSRNIFEDDEKEILAAAKRHGFKMVGDPKAKAVSFVKMNAAPAAH